MRENAKFTVALDSDRETEIQFKVIVSPTKNTRGRRGATVAFECGQAKRRGKSAASPRTQPAVQAPLKRRKAT